MKSVVVPAAVLALTVIPALTAGTAEDEPEKPSLNLRVTPRMGFSPLSALVTLELKGGGNHEDYYCPELEWEWGDGSRSEQESDCEPFVAGETEIERRFTNRHTFQRSGNYRITVNLRRSDRTVAKTSVQLNVRPGLGDSVR